VQQLHLVGFTTDLDSLIFSARKGAKSGGFVLPLDERLLETIADAVRRRVAEGDDLEVPVELLEPAPPPRRQSQLSPREIQDRLRAGRSLEAIAAEAGVGEEWVARFAAPVEAERSQIVGRARALVYTKPRRGDSAETLGTSVRWNLADRGVRLTNDEFDDRWSAYQIADHAWMVTFSFVSRKRDQEAEWEVDLATGDLVSRNRLASDLGYVEPGGRRRSLASLQPVPLLGTKGARRIGAPTGPVDTNGDDGGDEASAVRPATRARKAAKRPAGARRPAKEAAVKRPAKKTAATSRPAAKKAATTTRPAKKAVSSARPAAKATSSRKAAGRTAARPVTSKRPAKAVAAKKAAPRATAAKRAPARKAAGTAKRAAKATRKAPSRGRDVPPAAIAPEVPVARPEPNELGQRRLQLATGAPRPAGTGRPSGPTTAPHPEAAARRGAPPRIAATRSIDRPVASRPAPAAVPTPIREVPVEATPAPAPQPELDVIDEAAAARRRAERRAARAAARESDAQTNGRRGGASVERPPASAPDVPEGDGRVVTIRANRATPPTGDADGDVIIAGDRPPLRPAQPATQPRRRRFARPNR
jgi:hypothetical protein